MSPTIHSHLRFGHAPGHIRDAFCERIETALPFMREPVRGEASADLQRLAGLLWTCTDILPVDNCAWLGLEPGSTYAQAARFIRASLD